MSISGSPEATQALQGAWSSWTPTLANLTQGNGTVTARYMRVGKTVHWSFKFVLGSTSSVGTLPTFTLPVTGAGTITGGVAIGTETGNGVFQLGLRETSAGTTLGFFRTSGVTTTVDTSVSSTVPHTWGDTDVLEASGTYEAA